MRKVQVPQNDVNSQALVIREWSAPDRSAVKRNQLIASAETSKALFEIESPADGTLVQLYRVGDEVPFNTALAIIAESGENADELLRQLQSGEPHSQAGTATSVNATKKAIQLADKLGVDLSQIKKEGIISEEDVRALGPLPLSEIFLKRDEFPKDINRVLVIGAANGLAQVADILSHRSDVQIVGCVDDDTSFDNPFGFPHLGKARDVFSLYADRVFDSAIIAVSSDIKFRSGIFEECRAKGIPFINAIDPSARINRFSTLGQGNVICSFVHVGTYTVLGDNNFFSAHCNIDHHNIWGSHNTLGPGCFFSARVKVADRVKFGTGIFVQNRILIGEGSIIASGATIIQSIPERHIVKTQIRQTVTPLAD